MPGTTKYGRARRDALLVLIADFTSTRGYPPSIRDLAWQAGCAYSTIVHHIRALEAAGLVTRDARVARSLRVVQQP